LIRIVEAVLDEDGALPNGVCSCVCETVREGCRELVRNNKVKQYTTSIFFFDEIGRVGNPTEIY